MVRALRARAGSGPSIGIVGLGLIGGSLAMHLLNAGCAVMAWNRDCHHYQEASAAGIECVPSLAELVSRRPGLLVLCNPLKAMPDVLAAIKPAIDQDATTLTDVGSVKSQVSAQVA